MGIIEVGSVVKLDDGTTAIVVKILNALSLGVFYTVMVEGSIKEINEMQIVEIIKKAVEVSGER